MSKSCAPSAEHGAVVFIGREAAGDVGVGLGWGHPGEIWGRGYEESRIQGVMVTTMVVVPTISVSSVTGQGGGQGVGVHCTRERDSGFCRGWGDPALNWLVEHMKVGVGFTLRKWVGVVARPGEVDWVG
eukprot:763864-Hanusia_phi.AAC.2